MSFFKFVFSFLYAKDKQSGEMEISQLRIALFSLMIFLILLGTVIAHIL